MRVAIQGIKGSFHHVAADQYFGKDKNTLIECLSFEETCKVLKLGQADHAVIAIENTTVGSFLTNYNLIKEYELFITGETYLRIRHNLMALPGQTIEDIRTVNSQEIAIAQCKAFLKKHPHLIVREVQDTALAAREVSEKKLKGVAAIGGYLAAERYGLSIIEKEIETSQKNYTRFLILSTKPNENKEPYNKASMSFRVSHTSGSLSSVLNVFKIYEMNLTKIQSVPVPELPYEYTMHVDLTWKKHELFEKVLLLLKERTLQCSLYGIYREGKKDVLATASPEGAKKKVIPIHPKDFKLTKDFVPVDWQEWLPQKPGVPKGFFVISGPCSAETEEQTLKTFSELASLDKISLFRAGVWKPRTRAGGFEGNGVKALKWLQKFQEETGNIATVEVATADHVKACYDYGINVLWIGARTSANPFSVQAIADAVEGSNVAVMIKNPVSPDLELWIGAVERIAKAGIKKIAAIHRGFAVQEKTKYRNHPAWSIALQFKERLPHIPLINDPSHICGRRDILEETCQKAIDLGANGIIIESHITPDEAWTDASQQVTPQRLGKMIDNLTWKYSEIKEEATALHMLRKTIDRLDADIISMIASRMKTAKEIGVHKKANGISIEQNERWKNILDDRISYSEKLNLSETFIRELLDRIHKESIEIQSNV